MKKKNKQNKSKNYKVIPTPCPPLPNPVINQQTAWQDIKISRKIWQQRNNKILVHTSSLIQPALFQEILATSYKILLLTGTGMRDSYKKIFTLFFSFINRFSLIPNPFIKQNPLSRTKVSCWCSLMWFLKSAHLIKHLDIWCKFFVWFLFFCIFSGRP